MVKKKNDQVVALQAKLTRALADYSNLEKRYQKESSSVVKFATSSLILKFLELRDHLASASSHSKDSSLQMILNLFDKILSDEVVKPIDTSGNFDPALMECQETVPGDKDKILSVTRQGYTMHDRLLRPARVVVGNGQPNPKSPEPVEGRHKR